jgi:two-component system response regulator MprA
MMSYSALLQLFSIVRRQQRLSSTINALESFLRAVNRMAGKILIVEDDAITRRNLSVLLSEEGYDVDQAGDGVDALEIIAGRPFDLVLSDIVMPRMDGLKLLQRLQFIAPQIPVMIMTSYVSNSLSSLPPGATEFIRKPFVLDDLLFKVQRALDKATQAT